MKSIIAIGNVMKKPRVRFALLVVFGAACVWAPLSIVWKYENTLRHGALYKFRAKPVDPVDAFRGRYVTLSFADDFLPAENPTKEKNPSYVPGGIQYVRLSVDAEGFAKPVEISRSPLAGEDVITVENTWWRPQTNYNPDKRPAGWTLRYPFSRYYLPENIAPEAEKLYAQANRRDTTAPAREAGKVPAYAAVRVRNGVAVLEELYLDGVPVREAVRTRLRKQTPE